MLCTPLSTLSQAICIQHMHEPLNDIDVSSASCTFQPRSRTISSPKVDLIHKSHISQPHEKSAHETHASLSLCPKSPTARN
ncbi:hypothetical protein CC80DRAFT_223394 [Byssothecium circinans]|uniref:Uncharacterized protein n=1 Tax=Byssothecium circinans TaxID=147558 RepID=A0A6A5TDN5_9PLEO|nr:hypothetical protein CC80DRAFT_294731 [Byssothecium circinans]KAF1950833.1 hypothetical protein CC80DRAFT_223394 [Byssothecium circinans]